MKNVCIAGYGAIGPVHAAAIMQTENAVLYAVCDIDPRRTAKCKELYDVKCFSDYDEMLNDNNIDCVHICTPHYLHFEMIEKAMATGKEVICEKPVTMTRSEYGNIKLPDKVCAVMQNRFNPCVMRMKEILSDGSVGDIVTAKAILTWHRTKDYYSKASWRGRYSTEGGGVMINQAIHTLDLLIYLIGEIAEVSAQTANFSLPEIEVEDTVTAYLSFRNNIKAMLFATNAYGDDSSPQIEIICKNAVLNYSHKKLYLNGEQIEEDESFSPGKSYWGNGHQLLIKNYYDRSVFFSAADIRNTMDTLFAIYESADRCKKIALNDCQRSG